MSLNNISIGTRLVAGFGLLVLIASITGLFAIIQIRALADITTKIYNHPLVVSSAVRDIRADIIAMHRSMKDVALAENNKQITDASQVVDTYERNVYKNFGIVLDRFLGDKTKVQQGLQSFKDWKAIRDEVIQLSFDGQKAQATTITKGIGAKHVELMTIQIQAMVDFAGKKADEFFKKTKKKKEQILFLMFGTFIALVIVGILISSFITRSITAPLRVIVDRIGTISQGDLSKSLTFKSKDEIGALADSFRELQKNLLLSVQAAKKIATLDFTSEIIPRSERDHFGRAFNAMTSSLRTSAENLKESDERYRILFNSESDAIFVVDVETLAILEANDAALKLYGYSLDEILQKKAPDLSAEPEKTQVTISKNQETEIPKRLHRKKDGTVFPVEIVANYISLQGHKVNVAAIRDISGRVAHEEEKKNMADIFQLTQNWVSAHPFIYISPLLKGHLTRKYK